MAGAGPSTPLEILTETISKSVLTAINEKLVQNNANMLAEVKSMIHESTSDIADRAAKRIRTDNPEFSRQGNRQQYEHNTDVLHTIERAANAVVKGDGEAAIAVLNQGKQAVTQRNKLVRMADREQRGWKMVAEYVKDDLADDSDDEKNMRRARKAAEEAFRQNRGRSQPTRGSYRGRGYYRRGNGYRPRNWNQQRGRSYSRGYAGGNGNRDWRRDRYDRDCHKCGRRGHLAYACREEQR